MNIVKKTIIKKSIKRNIIKKINVIINKKSWISNNLKSFKNFWKFLTYRKPSKLSWRDYWSILSEPVRYQTLIFPDGSIIEKKCSPAIPKSQIKLSALKFPKSFSGKTFLDIGCSEGFFVILAAARGAAFARGCDFNPSRIKIAKIVANVWNIRDRVDFCTLGIYKIPPDYAADIVACLSVSHHLHGGNHDTWQIISNPRKYSIYFSNMLRAVSAVSALTKKKTYWEISYEYSSEKPDDIDFSKLGRIWEEKGLYREVIFRGLSQSSKIKDRAIYHAYK